MAHFLLLNNLIFKKDQILTSYATEEDFLLDQIQSNSLAIEHINSELEKVISEMPEDHRDTKEKIINAYTRGISYLQKDNQIKKKKIRSIKS